MKQWNKISLIRWLIVLAVCAAALYFYPRLPDTIPAHWGFNGNIRYDSKETIFIMPLATMLMAVLFPIMRKIDPKSENYSKFSKFYDAFSIVMELFMTAMMAVILVETYYPGTINMKTFVLILIGLLFVFLGNSMPRVRHNYSMGVKTPWALNDENNWTKTQRLGGKCFFASGLIALICAFLPEKTAFVIFFAAVLVSVFIPYVMSYIWFRQDHK